MYRLELLPEYLQEGGPEGNVIKDMMGKKIRIEILSGDVFGAGERTS